MYVFVVICEDKIKLFTVCVLYAFTQLKRLQKRVDMLLNRQPVQHLLIWDLKGTCLVSYKGHSYVLLQRFAIFKCFVWFLNSDYQCLQGY